MSWGRSPQSNTAWTIGANACPVRDLLCPSAATRQAAIALERIKSGPQDAGQLHLTVADNGRGMQSSTRTSRFGLSGMRERVEMEGGTFVLDSTPGRGFRFEAHLPAHGSHHGQE
jgi:signal transduction histidine kinase